MPQFEIVVDGKVTTSLFANFADDALTEFLDGMEPHGVKRTGPTRALFMRQVEITARPRVAEVVPMYATVTGSRHIAIAPALEGRGRKGWRR